jgi:hypothetical protein
MDTYVYVLALFSVFGAYIAQSLILGAIKMRRYKRHPRIKGGVPFFGHIFQVPPVQQGPWAKDLAEKYGEMYGHDLPNMSLGTGANITPGSPAILVAPLGISQFFADSQIT